MNGTCLILCIFTVALFSATDTRNKSTYPILNTGLICSKYRRLKGTEAAGNFCEKNPKLLKAIMSGVNLGTKECQHQLRYRQWNCSTNPKILTKIMSEDTPEAGFVNAITAAAVTYAVAELCSTGSIADCSCHSIGTIRSSKLKDRSNGYENRNNNNSIKVATTVARRSNDCIDSVNYGYQISKLFVDTWQQLAGGKKRDVKSLIKLHNTRIGRLITLKSARIVCKCHGISGSCLLKTCWKKLPKFREIGRRLKMKFDHAVKVGSGNGRNNNNKLFVVLAGGDSSSTTGNGSVVVNRRSVYKNNVVVRRAFNRTIVASRLLKTSLVYAENSPDFCRAEFGSAATSTVIVGRPCLIDSSNRMETCQRVCCDRGSKRTTLNRQLPCRCKFVWCCKVVCDVCSKPNDEYVCV